MRFCLALASTVVLALAGPAAALPRYPWLAEPALAGNALDRRIPPPGGFVRLPEAPGSFAAWLRELPLKPGRPAVRLYDGRLKGNQRAHVAVVDLDLGPRDLQQCADAVIRLRAEYLYSAGKAADIAFDFTSGDRAPFSKWMAGWRPAIRGSRVSWNRRGRPDSSHAALGSYLEVVMSYAGSYSLARELRPVRPQAMRIGDVLVQGGFPGHAALVVDMAEDPHTRRKVFLLAQSYMPAQEAHVLKNPEARAGGAWFEVEGFAGGLATPEWDFTADHLRTWSRN
ncbi:MAG: DUF4846 domain-containing protein [Candidatus Sericytochromatia bacterium]|uniref:DUF4846 domain-containing protein n=1 Tax=Candidatus Tanganyikabacteria bacterium TaxID=2961651 RepID=A0A937X0E5_9BACT|nr:DUF4846 domain-containing protein [Candidatus Tanganyikabacteria bacterium]